MVRQLSNPQRTGSQADRIPADWGRVTKLESKRSARVRSEATAAEAPGPAPTAATATVPPPATSATTEPRAASAPEDANAKTGDGENTKTPCLQQVWRTVGFCYIAKTTSFRGESGGGAPPQGGQTEVAPETPAVTEGINAGSKQGSPKMSLRVKKLFTAHSKQFRQCVVCK